MSTTPSSVFDGKDLLCDGYSSVWQSFKNGNASALEEIYVTYFDLLCLYGRQFAPDNYSLVEDCLQDLFLTLYTNANKHNLADTNSIKYYLMKSLRRLIIRRRKAENKVLLRQEEFVEILQPETQLLAGETEQIKTELVKRFIDSLPARQKKAVTLRFELGLSYREIADIMHLQIQSVYKIIYKAIDNLKAAFAANNFKVKESDDHNHLIKRDKSFQLALFCREADTGEMKT